ncbi:uncharacterized protein DS421_3g70150 [Arachis hypogaea]|nr:uncharacterized protein DS421_3g70150 [Arachis hypogaea]
MWRFCMLISMPLMAVILVVDSELECSLRNKENHLVLYDALPKLPCYLVPQYFLQSYI